MNRVPISCGPRNGKGSLGGEFGAGSGNLEKVWVLLVEMWMWSWQPIAWLVMMKIKTAKKYTTINRNQLSWFCCLLQHSVRKQQRQSPHQGRCFRVPQ